MSNDTTLYTDHILELLKSTPEDLPPELRVTRAEVLKAAAQQKETDRFRLTILHDRQSAENNFFWQRFTAFSALNAGLLVLAASNAVASRMLVKWVGILLGIAWVIIQSLSWYYVWRCKDAYFNLCEQWDLKPPERPFPFTSSAVGTVVSFVTLVLWIAYK
jgi:hypothetical protein